MSETDRTANVLSSSERRKQEAKARTLIRFASITAALGVFLAALGDPSLARWLALLGIVLLVAGLHRFGRLGADPEQDYAQADTNPAK